MLSLCGQVPLLSSLPLPLFFLKVDLIIVHFSNSILLQMLNFLNKTMKMLKHYFFGARVYIPCVSLSSSPVYIVI